MIDLVLLRHGESVWNLQNVFTGWTDVGLSAKGEEEARQAGRLMKEEVARMESESAARDGAARDPSE